MKLHKYLLLIAAALFVLGFSSCATPNADIIHTSSAISAIEIYAHNDMGQQTGNPVAGVIDEVTGEIYFPIPNADRDLYDLTSLMVRATLPYDAVVYPSLSGLKDLSDPDNRFTITVTTADASTRTYTLWAFYTRR